MKYLVFLLAFFLVMCKTPESITKTNETFRLIERESSDTTLPGFVLNTTLSLPEITNLRIYDTIVLEDKVAKGQLRIWKNKYGELVAECQDQDETIKNLREKLTDRQSSASETIIAVDNRTWYEKLIQLIPWYIYVLIGFVLAFILRLRF